MCKVLLKRKYLGFKIFYDNKLCWTNSIILKIKYNGRSEKTSKNDIKINFINFIIDNILFSELLMYWIV